MAGELPDREHDRTLLHELFDELVGRVFGRQLHLRDPRLLRYLADLLAEFAHRDRLYQLRNAQQQPLEQVAEMLLEGDVLLHATSFDRERAVHKHVGDYTLFVTGLWPEWHARLRRRTADALLDYSATGRRSYYIASTFRQEPYGDEAPILRRLSEEFTVMQFGLTQVRQALDELGRSPLAE